MHDLLLGSAWAQRRSKNKPLLDHSMLYLLTKQQGRCTICGTLLLHADREPNNPTEWEQWHRTTRKAITKQYLTADGNPNTPDGTRLLHTACLRRQHPGTRQTTSTSQRLKSFTGLA